MFSFFIENDLTSKNKLGFKPSDSRINQFLSIAHELYKLFDYGWEVRGNFLYLWKAFDKVSNQGLRLNLKPNGISQNLIKINRDFSANRYPGAVFLNG